MYGWWMFGLEFCGQMPTNSRLLPVPCLLCVFFVLVWCVFVDDMLSVLYFVAGVADYERWSGIASRIPGLKPIEVAQFVAKEADKHR